MAIWKILKRSWDGSIVIPRRSWSDLEEVLEWSFYRSLLHSSTSPGVVLRRSWREVLRRQGTSWGGPKGGPEESREVPRRSWGEVLRRRSGGGPVGRFWGGGPKDEEVLRRRRLANGKTERTEKWDFKSQRTPTTQDKPIWINWSLFNSY